MLNSGPSHAIGACVCALILVSIAGCTSRANTHRAPSTVSLSGTPNHPSQSWNFDADPTGQPPSGSTVYGGTWTVRAESGAPSAPNAACQTAAATFPALRLGTASYTNLALSVRFKPISGSEDQAAGLVFRIVDRDNYYILRANALEGTLQFFRYVGGNREELNSGTANVPSGSWQSLRVEASGTALTGFLNDRLAVHDSDSTFTSGGVGLWTKADSVMCFDDVRASASQEAS